jgi:hypothetical protein
VNLFADLANEDPTRTSAVIETHCKQLFIIGAVLLGVSITAFVFYPGVMSPDSVDQFRQARTGQISGDVFPPIMAFVWHYADRVIPGPFGMLLLHNLAFWGGLGLLAWVCRFGPVASALWVLGIGLYPSVFALLGIVWKDVGMATALTLCIGMALAGGRQRAPGLVAVSLLPLLYALSVRLNALPAMLPIASLICASLVVAIGRAPLRARTYLWLGAMMTLLMLAVASVIDRMIVTFPSVGAPSPALQASLIHDIAGISVYTGEVLFPDYILRTRPEITVERLRDRYRPADVVRLVSRRYWEDDRFFTRDPQDFGELWRAWCRAVIRHPLAYLHRRAGVMETIFQLSGEVFYPFEQGIPPNDLGLHFPRRPVYLAVVSFLERTTDIFFRSWPFLVTAIGITWWAFRRRTWTPVAVCVSGVAYVLPYAVVSSGSDFRYVWWLIVATLMGAMLLISDLMAIISSSPTHRTSLEAAGCKTGKLRRDPCEG